MYKLININTGLRRILGKKDLEGILYFLELMPWPFTSTSTIEKRGHLIIGILYTKIDKDKKKQKSARIWKKELQKREICLKFKILKPPMQDNQKLKLFLDEITQLIQ